ncbi:hypothetical protein R1sor_004383 [Riccia sorocarpa]|uniref:Uncharacterized protein n=1 Tax=Riccia sorocarpa TaxID=122646 RepID=A0ABD3HK21_9MARC
MTQPPRPKYPSDFKTYHDIRKSGFAHTAPAESAIQAVVQASEPIVVDDSQQGGLGNVLYDTHMENFEEDPGAEFPIDVSDFDEANEAPILWDFTTEGDDVVCGDSQIPTCNSESQALHEYVDTT